MAHEEDIAAGIAVDVVLFPPREVIEEAIRLNRELLKTAKSEYVLSPTDRIPHLSLVMGCVNEPSLPMIEKVLEEIAATTPPIALRFNAIDVRVNAAGEPITTLAVAKSSGLQSLHQEATGKLSPYLVRNASAWAFIGFPDVKPSSVEWVNSFRTAASFDRFSPHITLGIGRPPASGSSLKQTLAKRLAVCHLGNYCTCRKVLFETELRGFI